MTTSITGYHLAILCHKFRNRGRRFVSSILLQEDFTLPRHLTIFYCDPKDRAALESVADKLDNVQYNNLTLEFSCVPETKVMERSSWFSRLKNTEHLSHVVYTDCDLWFPPLFWKDHTESLEQLTPGYWSTYVWEIAYDHAEEFVHDTRIIKEGDLRRLTTYYRHNSCQGAVGHFQCVPISMSNYPCKYGLKSVAQMDHTFFKQALAMSSDKTKERRIGTVPAYHLGHPLCWKGTAQVL